MSFSTRPPAHDRPRPYTPAVATPADAPETRRRVAPRLPSLDGLRAISISLVIAWHVADLDASSALSALAQLWRIDAGNLGVRTFFVLSGFLITTLLLDEHRATGTISLRRFYLRRTFRIMPAFYAFLAAMAIAGAAGWQPLSTSAVVHAATYTSNYLHTEWLVGHTWTLSVEEQFYLLWPGLLLLAGVRGGFRVATAMLLVSPLLRAASAIAGPGHWPDNPRYAFETVADALASGCLLARHRDALWRWAPYRRLLSARAATAWPLAVVVVSAAGVRWPLFGAAIGVSALNMLIAIGIDWSLRFPETPLGAVLNARPVAFVGTLSFSLYLWQQPFLSSSLSMPVSVRLVAIGVAALLSYHVVEKPTLRWRGRLEQRWLAPRR